MAHQIKGLYRRGEVWWFNWQVEGARKHVSLGTRDEGEAIVRALRYRERRQLRFSGVWGAELRGYLQARREAGLLSPATEREKRRILERFFAEMGEQEVARPDEVRGADVERWRAAVVARATEGTANDYLAHVQAFFAWMVKVGKLRESPCRDVAMLRLMRVRRKVVVWKADVARLIAEAPDDEVRLILLFGFDLGMRKMEYVEARPVWFSRGEGFVSIERTETFIPKDREERTVPLTGRLREFLAERKWKGKYMLRPEKRRGKWRYRFETRVLYRRYMDSQGFKEVTEHDMRRSFASNRAAAGVSLYKVAKWLGDDPAVVERAYAHLVPDDGETERGV